MTSSTDPDEIRAQIQATRAGLSQDVNQLGEKVNPPPSRRGNATRWSTPWKAA